MPTEKKSHYQQKKDAGLCTYSDCQTPVIGRYRCDVHATTSSRQRKAERERRKSVGLCINSGCDQPPAPNRIRCVKHLREMADKQHAKVLRWDAAGKCVWCGGRHGDRVAGKLCQKCAADAVVAGKRNYQKHLAKGLCCVFGCNEKPAKPPGRLCSRHLQDAADYRKNIKIETFETYGGFQCAYPGCTITNPKMLHLDHIGGGGALDREIYGLNNGKTRGAGHAHRLKLRAAGYPPGYRVLCANHNAAIYLLALEAAGLGGAKALWAAQRARWQARLDARAKGEVYVETEQETALRQFVETEEAFNTEAARRDEVDSPASL